MSTLIVAEKPSVARDIARVLGARRKGEGFLEGNGYRVTWALGHLVHYAEPDDYGDTQGVDWSGRWSMAQLPMAPRLWKLKTNPKTVKQLKVIKALLTAAETERIVCATDAGREGEHIFRLIYQHAHCHKPFDRLWISSLTDAAIREGFQTLRPGAAYDHLAAAARARAQADWLIGMNLTRAYSVHNRVLCTIGRVQTPTLAMIVTRDQAIANFTKHLYYELVAHLLTADQAAFEARYWRDGETRIERKEEAERLHRELSPRRTGIVTKVEQKIRTVRPPPLYDLTSLQRDANRRFGFTAARVLELAQTLYETHKLISYPRTESRHISEDMLPALPGLLEGVDHPLAGEASARLASGFRLGKAYVDRTRLTDHHAILPTGKRPPAELPPPLRNIYDLVASRFVAVFLPDQRIEDTRAEIEIGEARFLARGARVLEPGWKRAELAGRAARPTAPDGVMGSDSAEPTGILPALTQGQQVQVERLEIQEKETQPPRHYDDASLLAAMKGAGREIADDALAAVMKSCGLGTPATRAEIIEKLIRAGYVERQRKQLHATPKGIALIGLVAAPLCSPALTAEWEQRLKDIEQGELDEAIFYRDILTFLDELLPVIAHGPALSAEQVAAERQGRPARAGARRGRAGGQRARTRETPARTLGRCPICRQGEVTESARAFGCNRYREGCGLTIWKTIAGLELSEEQVRALLEQGCLPRLAGFVSKTGKPFSAALRLDATGKVTLDFSTEHQADTPAAHPSLREQSPPCPKCGQGRIIEGRRGFGCNRYREGCDFVIWKSHAGIPLAETDIQALIEQGRTGIIVGLAQDTDRPGPCRLRLDTHWQVVIESAE
ncbi:MAG: type IA DNA topoisomerase [Sphingobacteriia bacterium]|nr:type IA DNA topoisomerase [Sphingobacteriia bacterium]NCC39776.1 type IA DNA topoisomerase [Gammaproteobacteria bacterium]